MKKRIFMSIICIILACFLFVGAGAVGTRINAADQSADTVSNLRKLKKIVKKKKKLSKIFKTEESGTGSLDWMFYKHKAKITLKGDKIYFQDHIYHKQRKTTIGEYTVKMVMNVGQNDTVKVAVQKTDYKVKYKYDEGDAIKSAKKWKKLKKQTLALHPSTYRYSKSLDYKNESFNYHSEVHTAMRCWNKLMKKNGKLSMSSIGFKNFKAKSISDENYYCLK